MNRTVNARIHKHHLRMYRDPEDDKIDLDAERPKTRADCVDGPRPCPFVSCRHHLYLDVADSGSIVYNFPGKEPHELTESCALDVADRGGGTLEDVGQYFQVTRERIRQIESKVLFRLKKHPSTRGLFEGGGFIPTEHSPMANAQDDSESPGGGGAAAEVEKTPEEEADEEFAGKIDRIYEKASRERLGGLPMPELPPLFSSPEVEEPTDEEVLVEAPEADPPAPEKKVMENSSLKYPLTEREKAVSDTYLEMAKKLGGKPSPLAIAEAIGLRGSSKASMSASVCTAITSSKRKGVVFPYLYDKPIVHGNAKPKVVTTAAVKKAPGPKAQKSKVKEPAPPTAMVVASTDPFKAALQNRREELTKQMEAIDTLLAL